MQSVINQCSTNISIPNSSVFDLIVSDILEVLVVVGTIIFVVDIDAVVRGVFCEVGCDEDVGDGVV